MKRNLPPANAPLLSHPSVAVALGASEINPVELYGSGIRFKSVIKWPLNNIVGMCNFSSQLQMLRKRGMRVSFLLLVDLDVSEYRKSIRYLHKIMNDPHTSVILYNLTQGVPAFLLERVNHVIDNDEISLSFSVNDLPVRKLALVFARQLGPHLSVLGLSPTETVTREQIRAQYKRRVLLAHPDKGGTAEQFEKLTESYDALIGFLSSRAETK